ncbi:fungal-specific transcription factor domain-containing protein [Lipomyces doorenjongii]
MAQTFERPSPDLLPRTIQQPQRSPLSNPSSPASSVPTGRSVRSPGHSHLNTSASGMIGSLPDDAHSNEVFGGSSAGSFINQVRTAAVRSDRGHSNLSLLHQTVLPARSKADQLLEIYWDIVYVLYPFVDKDETIFKYRSLWNGQAGCEEDHMFVCVLNVIFALSCQLNGTIEARRREHSAKMYYQRAKELLDLWTIGSFQSVQVYLLLGLYFQSTNEPHQCWMMIGAAVRTAQSLGLHLPETTERISSSRRRELTRKVWHGCIIMDRVVSMTYGRPPMISAALAAAVPRPLAIDEERLPREDGVLVPQSDRPSILDFFLQTLELYEILYDILVGFYSSSLGEDLSADETWDKYLERSGVSNIFSTLDIERRLVRWERGLPSHLKLDDSNQDEGPNKYSTRQAVILHQRYLYIRLLSLRPVLSAYVASGTSSIEAAASFGGVLSQRIALQCAIMCVTVAQETIELTYTKRPFDLNSVGPIAAWWYNVLFIYSAATVLIAAKLCPSISSEISEDSISHSWSLAIEILQSYQVFNPVIEQHVTALHLLFNVLPKHYLQSKETRLPEATYTRDFSAVGLAPGSIVPTDTQAQQLRTQDNVSLQPNETNEIEDPTLQLDRGPGKFDFDFVFDNNDLSWLHTMPFELYGNLGV